jgi:hypothetical protein
LSYCSHGAVMDEERPNARLIAAATLAAAAVAIALRA